MLFFFKNVNNFFHKRCIFVRKKKLLIWKRWHFPWLHDSSNIRIREGRIIIWNGKLLIFFVEKLYYFVQLSMHTVANFMTKKNCQKISLWLMEPFKIIKKNKILFSPAPTIKNQKYNFHVEISWKEIFKKFIAENPNWWKNLSTPTVH